MLDAPPATIADAGKFVVLTMTCHRDLIQYLVAIKSFTRYASPRKVFVLDDGSLTGRDKETLEKHVPGIEFLAMPDFHSEACPRGGCWERLLAVAELAKHDYVVQMDADTLTRGETPEVLSCVEKGEVSYCRRMKSSDSSRPRDHAAANRVDETGICSRNKFSTRAISV